MKPEDMYLPENVDWIGPDDPDYTVTGLVHTVRLPGTPPPAGGYPAVVMVHGWGGNEGVMWIFAQAVPHHVAVIAPRAPIDLGNGGHTWYGMALSADAQGNRRLLDEDGFSDSVESLNHFIGTLPDVYPVNPKRVVLMGFSQGASMVGTLLRRRPGCAIGMVSLAGFLPNFGRVPGGDPTIHDLPVFIAHGSEDEVVPPTIARRMRDRLEDLGARVTYEEYPVGHRMNPDAIRDLSEWLTQVLT